MPGRTASLLVTGSLLWLLAAGRLAAQGSADRPREQAILERLNQRRKGAGLACVAEDAELSRGCRLHAEYLARNSNREETKGQGAHREERSLPGFSEAGDASAKKSLVSRRDRVGAPEVHIDQLLAMFYHRLPLLHQRLNAVGIGTAATTEGGSIAVIDVTSSIDWSIAARAEPILYPGEGQQEVPVQFALGGYEWPDPRPDSQDKTGCPITATWDSRVAQPEEVLTAKVTADGKAIECWITSPLAPARKDRTQIGTVCLLPRMPLQPSTVYTVHLKCKLTAATQAWEKTWSFTTTAER